MTSQKRAGWLLDRHYDGGYHAWNMRVFALSVSLIGLTAGCSEYGAITKKPVDFTRLCASANPSTEENLDTNGTVSVSLKPRLIAPGMQLTVNIAEDPSMRRTYIVPPGCSIDIVAAGRVAVCGLTTNELAEKIRAPLERDYLQKATVSVEIESAINPGRPGGVVYIIGSIARPGPLLLPKDQVFTLTKAIIAAGGFSQFANQSAVRILRYCEDGKKYDTFVNVGRIMEKGEFERDVPLQPNDWVIIKQKFISF